MLTSSTSAVKAAGDAASVRWRQSLTRDSQKSALSLRRQIKATNFQSNMCAIRNDVARGASRRVENAAVFPPRSYQLPMIRRVWRLTTGNFDTCKQRREGYYDRARGDYHVEPFRRLHKASCL